MPTIDGLVTGLDTTSIVDGLVLAYRKQIDLISTRKDKVATQQTSFKGVEARLLGLRSQLATLSRTSNSPFQAKTVAVSDEKLVTAAASDNAAAGVYNLRVNQLARSHQLASQGFADVDAAITQGTLAISLGNGTQKTITIDGTNNTLQGLASAINSSGAGVSATIINDGSGGTPYRLLLTGGKSGALNTITIDNTLADSGAGLTKPEFLAELQTATDASVTLGTGPGALNILSETNRIDNAIAGVTVQLLAEAPATDVTITISRNTEAARTAITDFVGSFNDLMSFIDDEVRFDAESGRAGTLLGNRSVISIQDEIRRTITGVVLGVNPLMNRISAIGITVSSNGRLALNSGKLDDALAGRIAGINDADLKRLFSLDGQSDNAGVQFAAGSSRTKASQVPYQVHISQAAERAQITATSELTEPVVVDETNNSLVIKIDGKESGQLTLASGSYTALEIADQLEAVVNAATDLAGRKISVSVVNGHLQITSNSYGFSSEVTVTGGTSLDALGFDGTETDKGLDVVGSFIVDGVAETAKGSGRLLIGDSGNANTADLQVRVTLTSSQVQGGMDVSLTVTRGLTSTLDQILSRMLDPVSGRLKAVNDGFQSTIDDFDKSIQKQNERMELQREALIRQFSALEAAVSGLRSTGDFLTTQLAALGNLRRKNN